MELEELFEPLHPESPDDVERDLVELEVQVKPAAVPLRPNLEYECVLRAEDMPHLDAWMRQMTFAKLEERRIANIGLRLRAVQKKLEEAKKGVGVIHSLLLRLARAKVTIMREEQEAGKKFWTELAKNHNLDLEKWVYELMPDHTVRRRPNDDSDEAAERASEAAHMDSVKQLIMLRLGLGPGHEPKACDCERCEDRDHCDHRKLKDEDEG